MKFMKKGSSKEYWHSEITEFLMNKCGFCQFVQPCCELQAPQLQDAAVSTFYKLHLAK